MVYIIALLQHMSVMPSRIILDGVHDFDIILNHLDKDFRAMEKGRNTNLEIFLPASVYLLSPSQ